MKALNSNLTNFIICSFLFFGLVTLSSCNKANIKPKLKISEPEMSAIMKSHITIKDTLYVLNISKEEALKLGVSDSFYTGLIGNIERGNKMIKKTLKSDNCVVSIIDMKTDSIIEIRKGNQKQIKK